MLDADCTEIWKPVVGYDGLYSVSSMGRVRRDATGLGTRAGRLLNPGANSYGYIRVGLRTGRGRRVMARVHRLVLEAFVGSCPFGCECNHIDGNKQNNAIGNLEWVTPLENMRHSFDVIGRNVACGVRNGMSKLNEWQVRVIRRLHGRLTYKEIADVFGVDKSLVGLIRRQLAWTHVP